MSSNLSGGLQTTSEGGDVDALDIVRCEIGGGVAGLEMTLRG